MTQINADKNGRSMSARVRARRSAVQALYQWFLTGRPMSEIITEFELERKELKKADGEYFRAILTGSAKNSAAISDTLTPFLDRALDNWTRSPGPYCTWACMNSNTNRHYPGAWY